MLFDRRAKYAFVVACVTLAACNLSFRAAVQNLNVHLEKQPVELQRSLAMISKRLGPWEVPRHSTDRKLEAAIVEELGTDVYLDRTYALQGDPARGRIDLHISYYTGMIDAVPHVADRCFRAGGLNQDTLPANLALNIPTDTWRPDAEHVNQATGKRYQLYTTVDRITGEPQTVRMPIGEVMLRTTEFSQPDYPDLRIYAGYTFIANGLTTPQPEAVRALAFDLSNEYAYYCKVQLTSYGGTDFDQNAFVERGSAFMEHLLPELMRCLPDWAEVERRNDARTTDQTQARKP